jgi:serine/threonine protein kinase
MDIKPQNLLIDKNLNIKITDFSAAFSFENYRKNQKILLPFSGTSLYMSPEVLSNDYIDYDECNKVDLYSLGVVLYFLAFDKFPYKLDLSYNLNFSLILKEIKNNKLSFPETEIYSKLFLKFINKLLEKDIKNRLNIYDALNDPWIKGAELLFKEKEKIDDTEIFLINIITDNFRCFNEYINSF